MAVSRRMLDSAFIEDMRSKIDARALLERQQSFALATPKQLAEKPELFMTREQLMAAKDLLDRRIPRMKEIDGLQPTNDNRVTIQVIKFSDDNQSGGSQTQRTKALLHGQSLLEGSHRETFRSEQSMHGVQSDCDI